MNKTKKIKKKKKKRKNLYFLEIELFFKNKKGAKPELMAKSQFLLNSDVYFSKK